MDTIGFLNERTAKRGAAILRRHGLEAKASIKGGRWGIECHCRASATPWSSYFGMFFGINDCLRWHRYDKAGAA